MLMSSQALRENTMYRFQVEGMSCGHCVSAIGRAIAVEDPQAKVSVDLASQSVVIASDAGMAEIAEWLAEAGYPVRAMSGEPASR